MGRKKWQIDTALKLWKLTHVAKRIGGVTPFRQAAGLIASEKAFKGSFIPVGEAIDTPPGTAITRELVADFIERACNRTIINECPCRAGEKCDDYPVDLGCMLLGRASMDVNPGVGRRATVEEGLAHLDRALELGLLPLVGHILVDRVVFGVRDFSKLLTVCFCCDCCCVVRSGMKNLVHAYPRSMVRLEGVRVEVGGECTGCGECVPVCPVENIVITGGVAVPGSACLGCGTCARTCSGGHMRLTVDPDADLMGELKRRIEAGVDIES